MKIECKKCWHKAIIKESKAKKYEILYHEELQKITPKFKIGELVKINFRWIEDIYCTIRAIFLNKDYKKEYELSSSMRKYVQEEEIIECSTEEKELFT